MRPLIEFSPREIRQIEGLAALGFSQAEISTALGISERTFRNKKRAEDEVFAAWERGRLKIKAGVGAVIVRNALDGDQRAAEYLEATRFGISPKNADKATGDDEHDEEMMQLGDPHEELLRRYEEIAKRQEAAEETLGEEQPIIEREEQQNAEGIGQDDEERGVA